MMDIETKPIRKLIEEAFEKINRYEGGNTLFYQKFHKSKAVVSTWKYGKTIPSDTDMGLFLQTATSVLVELKERKAKAVENNSRLLNELSSALST